MSSPGQMQDGPGPAAMLHIVILRLRKEGLVEVLADAPVSLPKVQLPVFLATLEIMDYTSNPLSGCTCHVCQHTSP